MTACANLLVRSLSPTSERQAKTLLFRFVSLTRGYARRKESGYERALALPSDWPAIGRIAAGLAHEIRNPISAMRQNALATADEQRALSSTSRFINNRILQGAMVIAEGRADAAVTYMR